MIFINIKKFPIILNYIINLIKFKINKLTHLKNKLKRKFNKKILSKLDIIKRHYQNCLNKKYLLKQTAKSMIIS